MTTTIPALDFLLAGFALAWLLLFAYAARQWIVKHFGRAKPLPDIHPDRDEASAPESMIIDDPNSGFVEMVSKLRQQQHAVASRILGDPRKTVAARMQGNSEPREWPKHFFDERLPRRAAE